jgi:hypothetical protein
MWRLARPGQPREGAAVDRAGPAAENGGDEPPWGPPSQAELRAWDFVDRAARLMGDYESSYEADRAGYSYQGDSGDLDRYPDYRSSAQAVEAVGRYSAAAGSASAALAAAEARESVAIERLSQARAALNQTWPWQRHRRTGLRTLIEDAEEDLWALGGEAEFLALDVIRSDQLRYDAEWAAPMLSRRERAEAAARRAVVRTLGWQPGDVLPVGRAVFRAGPDGIEAVHVSSGEQSPEPGRLTTLSAPDDGWQRAAASRWTRHYEKAPYATELVTSVLVSAGWLEFEPAHEGVDGTLYQAGAYSNASGRPGDPVVQVRARAVCDLVAGWPDMATARAWAEDRVAGEGPLSWPDPATSSRTVREEQVLACMLRYPWHADALARSLTGHVFSTDVRDEIYGALRVVSRRGEAVSAATVSGEVSRRYAQAPRWAQDDVGGPDAPRAAAYLHRLARTEVVPDTALIAARALTGAPVSQPGPESRPPAPFILPPPGQQPGPGPDPGGLEPRTYCM